MWPGSGRSPRHGVKDRKRYPVGKSCQRAVEETIDVLGHHTDRQAMALRSSKGILTVSIDCSVGPGIVCVASHSSGGSFLAAPNSWKTTAYFKASEHEIAL